MATRWADERPVRLRIRLNARTGEAGVSQVARQIAEAIEEGRLRAGDALPSEDVLAEQLGVGRKVVRSAYNRLVEAGLLLRDFPHRKRVAQVRGAGKKTGGKSAGRKAAK